MIKASSLFALFAWCSFLLMTWAFLLQYAQMNVVNFLFYMVNLFLALAASLETQAEIVRKNR